MTYIMTRPHTFYEKLEPKVLEQRLAKVKSKWGVGEDFLYDLVSSPNYLDLMGSEMSKGAKKKFRARLCVLDRAFAHLTNSGYLDAYRRKRTGEVYRREQKSNGINIGGSDRAFRKNSNARSTKIYR